MTDAKPLPPRFADGPLPCPWEADQIVTIEGAQYRVREITTYQDTRDWFAVLVPVHD